MKRDATGPALSAIFIDYDNIYLSLKRKSDDAARRFSKDAGLWLRELETGSLITATSGFAASGQRRIVMNRCYGNPVPRRNAHDNSTDMSSFPFIRHHFLRSGAEVVDCPPLTAQLKNSADIRIVMDVRDMLTHETYFDEFIILSSDADFTPLLHRLRAHARRTVIYANDQTVSPYTAISDGEVREADLLRLLLDSRGTDRAITSDSAPANVQLPNPVADFSLLRRDLANEAANLVRAAGQPVPLEALADRLVRTFGHERTAGSGWAGMGGFRDLLASYLPEGLKISEQPPFVVFDVTLPDAPQRLDQSALPPRQREPVPNDSGDVVTRTAAPSGRSQLQRLPASPYNGLRTAATSSGHAPGPLHGASPAPVHAAVAQHAPAVTVQAGMPMQAGVPPVRGPVAQSQHVPQPVQSLEPAPSPRMPAVAQQQASQSVPAAVQNQTQPPQGPSPVEIQQMVARIYDACQAPGISPPEYRLVFDIMAQEISARGLNGMATLESIGAQAKTFGIKLSRDDVRFILEVVSEGDEWFEHGVSANLFAGRFRNFVFARCRSTGLQLSAEEVDMIDQWFATEPRQQQGPALIQSAGPPQQQRPQLPSPGPQQSAPLSTANPVDIWWSTDAASGQRSTGTETGDDFPRIVRRSRN